MTGTATGFAVSTMAGCMSTSDLNPAGGGTRGSELPGAAQDRPGDLEHRHDGQQRADQHRAADAALLQDGQPDKKRRDGGGAGAEHHEGRAERDAPGLPQPRFADRGNRLVDRAGAHPRQRQAPRDSACPSMPSRTATRRSAAVRTVSAPERRPASTISPGRRSVVSPKPIRTTGSASGRTSTQEQAEAERSKDRGGDRSDHLEEHHGRASRHRPSAARRNRRSGAPPPFKRHQRNQTREDADADIRQDLEGPSHDRKAARHSARRCAGTRTPAPWPRGRRG